MELIEVAVLDIAGIVVLGEWVALGLELPVLVVVVVVTAAVVVVNGY